LLSFRTRARGIQCPFKDKFRSRAMHLIPVGFGTLKRELQPAGRAIRVEVQLSG
jgi:hypothetical protein